MGVTVGDVMLYLEEDIYELMTETLGKGEFIVIGFYTDSYRAHPRI